ncbi:unnamed protein product [Blepharisma stoltei]|uniref:GRIP domain-containing protein n=1 Tax=Blepharisma stoltei TaxID=1481888 RepID=A0AAU9J8J8_9CILI|nr:unnamed protein product [Blepharisma stoltei]
MRNQIKKKKETHQQQKIVNGNEAEMDENESVIIGLQSKLMALEQKYIDFAGRCACILEENKSQMGRETKGEKIVDTFDDLFEENKKIQSDLDFVIDEKDNLKKDKNSQLKKIEAKIYELCMNDNEKRKTARGIVNEIKLMINLQENNEGIKRKFEEELHRVKEKYFKAVKAKDAEILKLKKEKDVFDKTIRELHKQARDLKSWQEMAAKAKTQTDFCRWTEGSRPASRCESTDLKKFRPNTPGGSFSRSTLAGSPLPISHIRKNSKELLKSYFPQTKEFSPLRLSRSSTPASRSVSPQNREFHKIKKQLNETKQKLDKITQERDNFKAWKTSHTRTQSFSSTGSYWHEFDKKKLNETVGLIKAKANTIIKGAKNYIDASVRAQRAILNSEFNKSETIEKAGNLKAKLRQIIRDFESDKFLQSLDKGSDKNLDFWQENEDITILEGEMQKEKEKNEEYLKIIDEKNKEKESILRELEKMKDEVDEKEKNVKDLKEQNMMIKMTMKNMREIFQEAPRGNLDNAENNKMITDLKNILMSEVLRYYKKFDDFSDKICQAIIKREAQLVKVEESLNKIKSYWIESVSENSKNSKNISFIDELLEANKALKESQILNEEKFKKQINDLASKISGLENEKYALENELLTIKEKQIKESSNQTSYQLKQKAQEIERLSQLNIELKNEINILENQLQDSKTEYESKNHQLEKEMKIKIDAFENQIKFQKNEFSKLEKELKQTSHNMQNSNKNLEKENDLLRSDYELKINDYKEDLNKKEAEIIEKDIIIEELNENINNLENRLKCNNLEAEEKIHNLNTKIFELNKLLHSNRNKSEEKSDLQASAIEENEELKSQINSICLELNEATKSLQKEKTINKDTKIALNELSDKIFKVPREKEETSSELNIKIKQLEKEKLQISSEYIEKIENINKEFEADKKRLTDENSKLQNEIKDFINSSPNNTLDISNNIEEIAEIINEITDSAYSESDIVSNFPDILLEIKGEYLEVFDRNSQLEKFCKKFVEDTNAKLKFLEDEKSSILAREKELKEQVEDLKILNYETTKLLDEAKLNLAQLEDDLENEKSLSLKLNEENDAFNNILDENSKATQELNQEIKDLKQKNFQVLNDYTNQRSVIEKLTEEKEYLEQRLQSAIATTQLSGNQLRENNLQLQSQVALLESSNNSFAKMKLQLESKNSRLEFENSEYAKIIEEKNKNIKNNMQKITQQDSEIQKLKHKFEKAANDCENEKKKNIEMLSRIQNEEITYQTNLTSLENELRAARQERRSSFRKMSAPLQEPSGEGFQFRSSNIKLFVDTSAEGLKQKDSEEKVSEKLLSLIKQLENLIEKNYDRKIPEPLVALFNKYASKLQSANIDHDIDIISAESPNKSNYPQLSNESPTSLVREVDSISVDSQEANYRTHFKILEQKSMIDELNKKLLNKKRKLIATSELTKALKDNIKDLQSRSLDVENLRNSLLSLMKLLPPLNIESQAIIQTIKSQLNLLDKPDQSEGSIKIEKKGRWNIFG